MTDLLPLLLLGGLLGLDVVSFPQMMISRPLVAATIAGAFVGHAGNGILAGAALELIALATLPFGASRYPEWGSAAVVAGAIAGVLHTESGAVLTVAVLSGLSTAWLGGWTMVQLRRWNARLARHRRSALDAGARGAVIGLQLAGLTSDLVRGAALTALGYGVLFPLSRAAVGSWRMNETVSRGFIVTASCAVAGAAAWTIFHSARGSRWYFAIGLLVGLILLAGR